MTGRRGFNVRPDPVIAQNPVGSLLEAGFGPDGLATACFDRDRKYRYRLSRVWDESLSRIVWCMLNPSTASAFESDRTLNKIIRYSRAWGYGAVEVVNLFAYRTPYPSELRLVADPVGLGNDDAIAAAVGQADMVVAAWGNHGMRVNPLTSEPRYVEAIHLFRQAGIRPHCLRSTERGQPGHPLRLPRDLRPFPMM